MAKDTPDLLRASEKLMEYLSFMVITKNKKYPFRPSLEGEKALCELGEAIAKSKGVLLCQRTAK